MEEVEIITVGSGPPELWIVAGVHGDEVEGIACVEEAVSSIEPRRGTLVGVPGRPAPEVSAIGLRASRPAAARLGMVEEEPVPSGRTVSRRAIRAGAAGRVRQLRGLGEAVAASEPVCELRALDGRILETLL